MSELPTFVTDGYEHHFQPGDAVKWFPADVIYPRYADVVRVNKKTITIKMADGLRLNYRVDPRELNFD